METLHLPLVVKLEPGFVIDFCTPRLSSAVVAGSLAILTAAKAAGRLAVSAAAGTVEGTVEAVVLAAATSGGPGDD